MKKELIKTKEKSFTLIEVLTAVAIFGLLSIALISTFVAAINAQASIYFNQNLISETSYILEYMDRSIRMAVRDTAGACTGTADKNYSTSTGIIFLAYDTVSEEYRCRQFYLSSNKIMEKRSTDATSANFPVNGTELSSSRIKVNTLGFDLNGTDVLNTNQPKITVLINAEANSKRVSPVPKMIIQTSISQRNLNFSE